MIEEIPTIRVQAFSRPDPALMAQVLMTPTGFLVDAMGGVGALDFKLAPAIAEQFAFCGVALTCHAGPADNLALIQALAELQPGDVLVAAADGFTGCAITGDLVLGMAKNCGAVGFVTDGCVRDLILCFFLLNINNNSNGAKERRREKQEEQETVLQAGTAAV